jgi:ribosomal protein L13E
MKSILKNTKHANFEDKDYQPIIKDNDKDKNAEGFSLGEIRKSGLNLSTLPAKVIIDNRRISIYDDNVKKLERIKNK